MILINQKVVDNGYIKHALKWVGFKFLLLISISDLSLLIFNIMINFANMFLILISINYKSIILIIDMDKLIFNLIILSSLISRMIHGKKLLFFFPTHFNKMYILLNAKQWIVDTVKIFPHLKNLMTSN